MVLNYFGPQLSCEIVATVKGNWITGGLTLGVVVIVMSLFGKKRDEEREWIKILGDKYPHDID